MNRTLQMFDVPKQPRASRVHRMHVIDAGDSGCDSGESGGICRYKCIRCGHETDWMPFRTTTEAKRGIPCPTCNQPKEEHHG